MKGSLDVPQTVPAIPLHRCGRDYTPRLYSDIYYTTWIIFLSKLEFGPLCPFIETLYCLASVCDHGLGFREWATYWQSVIIIIIIIIIDTIRLLNSSIVAEVASKAPKATSIPVYRIVSCRTQT